MSHLVKARVCWSSLTNLSHQGREGAASLFVLFRLLWHQADTRHKAPIYGAQISARNSRDFLITYRAKPNYDHVLFSKDNHYLIIRLVTRPQPRTIPTILGFRERSTLASSCPAQPGAVKFLSDQDFILLPPSLMSFMENLNIKEVL